MGKFLFDDRSIADLELPEGKDDMWAWDTRTSGLGLRLRRGSANVSKTWYVSYTIAGDSKRDPLGKFSDLTLNDARALVYRRRREIIENGTDPRAAQAEREAKAAIPTIAEAAIPTIAEAVEAYLTRREAKAAIPTIAKAVEAYPARRADKISPGGKRMRNEADRLHEQWLDEIVSLEEAAKLRGGIAVKTLRSEIRRGALKDVRISKKRRGMTRREALRECRC
jgi:hypothetical protein